MLMRAIVAVVLLTCAGLVLSGCSHSACSKLCEWLDDCAESLSDDELERCIEHCRVDYRDEESDCRAAFRDVTDCIEEEGCIGVERCAGEYQDFEEEDCDYLGMW